MVSDAICTHVNVFWARGEDGNDDVMFYTVACRHGDGPIIHGAPRSFDDNWSHEEGLSGFVGGDVVLRSKEYLRLGGHMALTPREFEYVGRQLEGHYSARKNGIRFL